MGQTPRIPGAFRKIAAEIWSTGGGLSDPETFLHITRKHTHLSVTIPTKLREGGEARRSQKVFGSNRGWGRRRQV